MNKSIRSLCAFGMMLIFLLSIMPKQTLHDVFAKHQDIVQSSNDPHQHLYKSGFDCDCNTLVATSPFTEQEEQFSFAPLIAYHSPVTTTYPSAVFSRSHTFFELRGPPVLA